MSLHSPLVSVVLPTFNRADTILRAIWSVLDQTHSTLELIIVDDGSEDDTQNVIQSQSDPRIRIIKLDQNRGQSFARNVGIQSAQGQFVAFQDSDDVWLPQKLERQLKILETDPSAAGVYCDLLRIPAEGANLLWEAPELVVGAILDCSGLSYQTMGIGIQSCMLRKRVITQVGGFRESMRCFEDLELFLRIIQRWPMRRLSEALVHYYDSDGSVSCNAYAERHARKELLRRFGASIAFSNPRFILNELEILRQLKRKSPPARVTRMRWALRGARKVAWWSITLKLTRKVKEWRTLNEYFDSDWYLETYPDVAAAGRDPPSHYLSNGAAEGRDPGPSFSTRGYLAQNPDVAALGLNPLLHYVQFGRAEGRKIAPAVRLECDYVRLECDYKDWIRKYDALTEADIADMRRRGAELAHRPKISILMPTYNAPDALLTEAIDSVLAQTYDNWELCIADNASTATHVGETLRSCDDPRIKLVFLCEKVRIALTMNAAFELATGEWVTMLDHDDVLAPHALFHVATAINERPDVQLIYSDDDKVDEKGRRYDPNFKPDFSLELFRSQNYLNHLTVHRAVNVRTVEGWRADFEGSQDYDLNLRIIERIDPSAICHIPQVLYHWRAVRGSTALAGGEKHSAYAAGLRALRGHVERLGLPARVEEVTGVPFYRLRFSPPEPNPLVSIIIPTRDHVRLLRMALNSILERTTYDPFEVLIVDNGSVEEKTKSFLTEMARDPRIRVLPYPHPFNYSAINNFGARAAKGTILALVNNDVEVISPGWLTEMVAWAAQDEIGCVGAKLYYPNNTIQHGGMILGIFGGAGHSHRHFPGDHSGYFFRLKLVQNLSAVTGACLVVRKDLYYKVGGLDEESLAVAFNDVDFCLKVRAAGYRNVWTPFAELYHHESVSRGQDDTPEKQARASKEARYVMDKWVDALAADPFYSPHLTREKEDFSIGNGQEIQNASGSGPARASKKCC